ncbi:hypothetical protein [Scytonema sp. PCC 10023]|uniref:hypothetical protein n=1 Tax=Scytonema sp. PCC 10023 TaxID=1680591 RepID=UPI0039C6C24E
MVQITNANVICRSYTRKAAERAILGVLNTTLDPTLLSLAMIRSIPLFGGFAEPLMTVIGVRLEKLSPCANWLKSSQTGNFSITLS